MALSQFLGDTSEIRLIDFFISDGGNSYNISELNEQTGLSRVTLTKKIPELIQNKILEVDNFREEIVSIIGRNVLEKKLGIKTEEQIDAMIQKCGLTPEFLKGRTHYDIIQYILLCYNRK
jgi:hypothetical protein